MREHKGKSIIALPREYVVIDTETTGLDFDYNDIIELSAVKCVDGKPVDSLTSLIKPPLRTTYYPLRDNGAGETVSFYVDEYITNLTGITNEMLETAPDSSVVLPQFKAFIGDSILLAHNASFDVNFIYDALEKNCGLVLDNDYIDTLRIARKVFPQLEHHRLSDIASACGIDQPEAHRSEVDCMTTAQCFECMRSNILAHQTEEDFQKLFARNYRASLSNIAPTADFIDDTNPIYEKVIVFTGALSSMSRREAFQIVANLGAVPEDSITKKTNYLVIGHTDFIKSITDGKTSKMKKAESMQQKGSEISIISENSFFDLISDFT